MKPDLEQVTRLQSLDRRIAVLDLEVAALPKHIARIEKALDSHLRVLEADRAALSANIKDRKRLEDDIKVHEQKISKLKDQMLLAKTNDQYRAFQNEIDYAARETRKCEDSILDLMSSSEPLDAAVKKAEAALKEEQKEVDREKIEARQRTATDQGFLDQLHAERKELVGKMSPQVYTTYERLRKKSRGSAVSEVVDGRCSMCQIILRPQFYQDLRKGDSMMFCETCGRIVVYNRPVSFEADLAAPIR